MKRERERERVKRERESKERAELIYFHTGRPLGRRRRTAEDGQ